MLEVLHGVGSEPACVEPKINKGVVFRAVILKMKIPVVKMGAINKLGPFSRYACYHTHTGDKAFPIVKLAG